MRFLQTLWELFFFPLIIDAALLPQLSGLGAFWFLKRKSFGWARAALTLLPPFLFCILWWYFIKWEEARLLPAEYLVVGFYLLLLWAFMIVGAILNLGCGFLIQFLLARKSLFAELEPIHLLPGRIYNWQD